MSQAERRIAPGEWILVTGANGYIASHIIDVLLDQGYNVRGTVRGTRPWLNKYFENKYGTGRFETQDVPSIEKEAAFNESVKGISGIIHVASDVSFSTDTNAVVSRAVNSTVNLLTAAAKEPSVKSVVLTSSSSAALIPEPNKEGIVVDEDTWNNAAIKAAYDKDTPKDLLPLAVYAASKTQGERAFWDWANTNKPGFAVNAVLPNMALGTILVPSEQHGSTMGFVRDLIQGKTERNIGLLPPQWYISVVDIARVHVAALLSPKVSNERLFAFAAPFNWTDILNALTKLRPENKLIPTAPEGEGRDLSDVWEVSRRAEGLVKEFFGVQGWVRLEESLENGIQDLK